MSDAADASRAGGLLLKHHTFVGEANPQETIEVLLKLRRKKESDLPTHAEFLAGRRVFCHRSEFSEKHGASEEDIATVTSWANDRGMSVAKSNKTTRSVYVKGAAKTLADAFNVSLKTYQHRVSGKKFRAHEEQLTIPDELQDIVIGAFGLDNCEIAHRPGKRTIKPDAATSATSEKATEAAQKQPDILDNLKSIQKANPDAFIPNQVAQLYNFPKATGKGEKVAILEFGGSFSQETLDEYFSKVIGLKNTPKINAYSVLGATEVAGSDSDEVYLDIEVVGAIAPDAEIDVYLAPLTWKGFADVIDAAVHHENDYAAISISWGFNENDSDYAPHLDNIDESLKEAVALGIPVFVSAGDHGTGNLRDVFDGRSITPQSELANVSYPASSPYVTGCGGTQLYAEDSVISNEVVWNELAGPMNDENYKAGPFYYGSATGGGVSGKYPVPSYQSKAGIHFESANPGSKTGRGVPDVAGNAGQATGYIVSIEPANGYSIYYVGGTSAVSPLWAALSACIRESLHNEDVNIPPFFFNDFLYSAEAADALRRIHGGRDVVFNQEYRITTAGKFIAIGNNRSALKADGYDSKEGFDLCTGLGCPDGMKLLQALKSWLKTNQGREKKVNS